MQDMDRLTKALKGMGVNVPPSAKTLGDVCLILESQASAENEYTVEDNGNPDDDADAPSQPEDAAIAMSALEAPLARGKRPMTQNQRDAYDVLMGRKMAHQVPKKIR